MGDSAPSAAVLLFTGVGQSGQARALGTVLSGRYGRYPAQEMFADGLWIKFRSGTLYAPVPGASTIILFGEPNPGAGSGYAWEWQGPHVLLTNNSDSEWDLDLGDFGFDKRTEAALLVHTQRAKETRLFWSQAVSPMTTQLSANLPDEVELDGPPSLGWHAFTAKPALSGGGALDAKRIYLTVTQNLTVVMPWWWADYSATIKLWIRLRINSDGVAVGWVQRAQYWIESGALADVVAAILSPNLKLAVLDINDAITGALATVNQPGTLTDLYFLPGRTKTAGKGATVVSERSWVNDVTIVFEGV